VFREPISSQTHRWREMDSNYLYRGTKSPLERADHAHTRRGTDGSTSNEPDQIATAEHSSPRAGLTRATPNAMAVTGNWSQNGRPSAWT